ncbi:MAG TPA: TolC family protein [Acidobacteriota bacterium]|nr:TolC family protein [Acidobacteriota bacterium]
MWKTVLIVCAQVLLLAVPAYADSYDLETFLARVEEHSNDLKLVHKQRELAAAEKSAALSGALPSIGVEASYNRNLTDAYMYVDFPASEDGEGGVQKFNINRNNEYAASAVLRQTLFNPIVYQAIKAARQYQKLTDLLYEAGHQDVITFAKKAYDQAILLRGIRDVTSASRENARANYEQVQTSYDQGVVSEFDLLQAEARWREVVSQASESERNFQLALIGLKNLAGIPQGDDLTLSGNLDACPPPPERLPLTAVLDQRPDFNALLWEEKLRETNVSAERAGYFPRLDASLIYRFSSQSDEWRFDESNDHVIAGLTLTIPIFAGGHTRARVHKARVELDQARIRLDQARDNVYQEVESVHLRLNEAHDRILAAEAARNAAAKAFEIADVSAANGLATQLELKDARMVYDQSQVNYYATLYEYRAAYYDWEKATGQGLAADGSGL